jgi:aspartate kinase
VPKSDLVRAESLLEAVASDIGARGVQHDPEIAKISLVGAGMKTHPGVAADMFGALAEAGVNIGMISTSSIRISCVVPAADVERAVRAVHERFRLHEPSVVAGGT